MRCPFEAGWRFALLLDFEVALALVFDFGVDFAFDTLSGLAFLLESRFGLATLAGGRSTFKRRGGRGRRLYLCVGGAGMLDVGIPAAAVVRLSTDTGVGDLGRAR